MMPEERHGQDARESRSAQNHRRAPRRPATASARQHDRTYGEAFGNLVQKDREENQPPQPVGNQESGSDRDTVEEGVNDQAEQDRVTLVGVNEFVAVRFFAEMKMRS